MKYIDFGSKFQDKWPNRPKFINEMFRNLEPQDCMMLERNFIGEEIKLAVFDCDNEKAPGPDGFTFKLLKYQWEVINDDVIRCIKNFEATWMISKGCNSSFITLIQKIKDLVTLGDYRLLSLIGCT
uniref:Reverse transcriptase domain-containing protein n=1 Tax=Lactuca sativa TaxID=4236 RepID=A0A9R1WP70_LACSA|nr:hypothetical protein LSAT_V11C100002470 [Lactuca sativa]